VYTPNSIYADEWALFDSDKQEADQWRQENLEPQKPVIAMFGQLKSKKGLDLALSLFSSFEFRQRAYLLTVGTVPEAMTAALAAGCGQSWIHVPFRKREKLPILYAAADIVFLPSYYDGMPNVLLEALACGCVVVASRAGAMPDVIRHQTNGFLFDTADITDAARVLNQALEMTPHHRQQMQQAARAIVEQTYTPDREVHIIENALKS
jgi:glycosyltransferase involved in cell wall biosynthesis